MKWLKSKCVLAVALLAVITGTTLAYTFHVTEPTTGTWDEFFCIVHVTDPEGGALSGVQVSLDFETWSGTWIYEGTCYGTTDSLGAAVCKFYVQSKGITTGFMRARVIECTKSGWYDINVPSSYHDSWSDVGATSSGGDQYTDQGNFTIQMGYGS